ncbi:pyridoxamine 5'-phosphate oxidase family protein [Anderseniella sp. Alg231-50]|uniref:pyridoxamine 5'-phosphate oxidase family protein n=1 Tax=Anderseniella sp. Alg231-50 TaxID=1922226 RepID=UPI000D556EF7
MTTDNVYHGGEIAVQQQAGVRDMAERLSQMIRPFMPDQHRTFFEMLPFAVVGMTDEHGRPWSTLCVGEPGFIRSPDDTTLRIASAPLLAQELGLQVKSGDKVGLLGIELPTRRRNRMNGVVADAGADGFAVHVEQSFGNCPQYIQTRSVEPRGAGSAGSAGEVRRSETLTGEAVDLIRQADTFYISSRTSEFSTRPSSGIDVSHRGGRPGFVHVATGNTLTFPDFSGNRLFNTLGNIADDGRVGMVFPDFETGDLLSLTGTARIVWDGERLEGFDGAQRLVDVQVDVMVHARCVLSLAGALIEQSPKLVRTGVWQ